MYRFDRVLIDPTPALLEQALTEASAAANKGVRARLLVRPFADLADFLKKLHSSPEGEHQWNGPGKHRKGGPGGDTRSAAAIAWWSDPLGRKHCRVVAARINCGSAEEGSLFWPANEGFDPAPQRPVLWRVYPDDLYLREQGGEWQLWAACRCGASGPPETLGWMGPWCAACHDLAEDGTPQTRPGIYRPVVFADHPFWVGDVAFSPEGCKLLARVDYYPEVWIWDMVTGQCNKRAFPGRPKNTRIQGLAIGADRQVAAICVSGQVRSWSLADGTDGPTFGSTPAARVALAYSPDATLVAVAYGHFGGGYLSIYDSATGQVEWGQAIDRSPLHWGRQVLAFSPDGRTLALGWGKPIVRLWDVASAQEKPAPPSGLSYVTALAYSPDGKWLAVGLDEWDDTNLRLCDVTTNQEKASFAGPIAGLAFSPDSRLLATVGGDGCLRLRDATDGHLLGAFRWHQSAIDTVAFSPDGHWLATGGKEDRIKLWPVDALLSP